MKSPHPLLSRVVALALLAAAGQTSQAAEIYDLDQSHSSIVFSISHMKMSYTHGMFRQAQARIMLDRQNPANCQFMMEIPVESIDTNSPQRDQHLKNPDFFNAAQFPNITFKSTACALDPAQPGVYQVTGDLTMHGVTRPITIPLRMLGEGPGVTGRDYHAGFMTQFELKRSEFGMDKLLNMVGDGVAVTVSFEAVRQDAAGASGAAPPPR